MCEITTEAETTLHITITPKTAEDMRTAYDFTAFQNQTLTEELDALDGLLGDLAITQVDAVELLQNLPEDLSPGTAAKSSRRSIPGTPCCGGNRLQIGW